MADLGEPSLLGDVSLREWRKVECCRSCWPGFCQSFSLKPEICCQYWLKTFNLFAFAYSFAAWEYNQVIVVEYLVIVSWEDKKRPSLEAVFLYLFFGRHRPSEGGRYILNQQHCLPRSRIHSGYLWMFPRAGETEEKGNLAACIVLDCQHHLLTISTVLFGKTPSTS